MKSTATTAVITSTTSTTAFKPVHQSFHALRGGASVSASRLGAMNFPPTPTSSTSFIRLSKLAISSGLNNTLA